MNKTRLLTPILAMISYTAYAEGPTVYGNMDVAIASANTPYGTRSEKTGTSLENWSTLGIKGSEQLSRSLKILYKMSFQVLNATTDGSSTPLSPYNTYLGLQSLYGTVLIGRNDTVFKFSEGGVDLFNGSNADIDRLVAGQTRSADAIWYYSPKLANLLTLNATYLMAANQNVNTTADIGSQYALTAIIGDKNLNDQNFYLASSYNAGIASIDAYRQVAQVKLGKFTLGGLYQQTQSLKTTEKNMKGYTYFVNLKYDLNGVNLKAEYGADTSGLGGYFTNATGGTSTLIDRSEYSNINMTQITVGADYLLSESTRLYSHYIMYQGHYKNSAVVTSLQNDNIFTVGVDYTF
ncbi:porin [Shewanella surugensis]|uniref:Porin n=1 Tax=Shewanella surugensis TaxID=212020 RepID=A0ABT0LA74_9GAMM|nr:porin [Shewanella surugensis]MCL1124574.1 porin [Shewanella surugensis]